MTDVAAIRTSLLKKCLLLSVVLGDLVMWVGDGVASIHVQAHFPFPERRDFSLLQCG